MNLTLIVSLLLLNILISGTRISQKKCAEYRKMIPMHYHKAEDAVAKEFPFMATIHSNTHFFSGILVSDNFVLSTASINFSDPTIILGDLDMGTNMDDAQPKTYKVINTFTHPDFKKDFAYADIKLYQLNESIKFNEYVRPACLSLNDLSASEALTQITWGTTNIRDNYILHKINLNYISNKSCEKAYKITNGRQNSVKDIETQNIFCAESKNGTRALISGGGGSAVIHDNRNSLDEVIGLHSWSVTPANYIVTVFVRVSSYIDWIESKVWSNHNISTTTQPTDEIQVMTVASTATTTHLYEFKTRIFARTSTAKHPANEIEVMTVPSTGTTAHSASEFDTRNFPTTSTAKHPASEIEVMTVPSTGTTAHSASEFDTRNFPTTSTAKHPAREIEVMTVPSTGTTTYPPKEFETKTFQIKFIFIIAAIIMTVMLCALVMYFLLFKIFF